MGFIKSAVQIVRWHSLLASLKSDYADRAAARLEGIELPAAYQSIALAQVASYHLRSGNLNEARRLYHKAISVEQLTPRNLSRSDGEYVVMYSKLFLMVIDRKLGSGADREAEGALFNSLLDLNSSRRIREKFLPLPPRSSFA